MGARIPVPWRVLLPLLAVGVVALGAGVVGVADVSGARGYLLRQTDASLLACAASALSRPFAAVPDSGPSGQAAAAGGCDIELLSASGQVLTPPVPGAGPGPAIPAAGSWLIAHEARPVTVPGSGASGRWRVVVEPVRYQPQRMLYVYGPDDVRYLVSRRGGSGPGGLLVVMAGLADIGRVTGQVTAGYAAAAGAVLALLAGAGLALARVILRPLRGAAGFADVFAPALIRISERTRASQTAEAAARRSAQELAGALEEVSRDLRTSVSVVRGFAEYCARRGIPPPADLNRMVQRVADEAARMRARTARLARGHQENRRMP